MLEGQELSRALTLLPMIFNVCGMAQAAASIRACESARGKRTSVETEQYRNRLVAMETLREHLWRIFLDWPEFMGTSEARPALAEIMGIQRWHAKAMFDNSKSLSLEEAHFKPDWNKLDLLQEKIERLLETWIYGMLTARWLDMESPTRLDDWMDRQQTVAASYLRKVRALGWEAAGSTACAG